MNRIIPVPLRASAPVSGTVVLLLVAAVLWFFYEVRAVLPPFVYAAVMAYLLNPFVAFLETRGVRRDRAVLALFVVLVGFSSVLAYWGVVALWGDLPDLRASWPVYMGKAETAMRKVQTSVEFAWPIFKRPKCWNEPSPVPWRGFKPMCGIRRRCLRRC
ncbi:MAG: AI-2E family transporter [Elusimicrobia bacterium]|nr:AI-2E family transporter [Elusimicrobiota bacterium]